MLKRMEPSGVGAPSLWTAVAVAALLAAGLLLAFVAWLILRSRRAADLPSAPPREMDLTRLGEVGPPPGAPVLELYHVPMRLAALVLAPIGRGRHVPSAEQLPQVLAGVLPGLPRVVQAHGTRVELWPPQLSAQGFASAFFAHLRLPGNRGKATQWSAVAGRVEAEGQGFLVGMVLRAAAPNQLSQYLLETEGQWLDVIRVRG
jgi:hypothetical protein